MKEAKKTKTKERLDLHLLNKAFEIKGHTFYTFKQPDLIPMIRLETFLARNFEFEELGIRKSDLIAFCLTIENYGNEGRYSEVQQLNGYFKSLLQMPVTLYPTIYLASSIIVLDNEKLNEVDPDFDAKKIQLALDNREVESFFLLTLMNSNPSLQVSSEPGKRLVYSNPKKRILEELFHQAIFGQKTIA